MIEDTKSTPDEEYYRYHFDYKGNPNWAGDD